MRARLDVQRGFIGGLYVKRWQIGQRPWVTGRLEDPYLKARTLMGGEHADRNLAQWKSVDRLLDEVRTGAIKLIPVWKPRYWHRGAGDPRNAFILRIEVPYHTPRPPLGHKCQSTWNRKTFTETGCGRPAVGRFRIDGGRGMRWLCALCAAEGV